MEEILSKLKFSIALFFLSYVTLFSKELIVAKENIPYKKEITPDNLALINSDKIPPNCLPITLEELKKDKYRTKKFIKEKKVICKDDIETDVEKSVIFKFGSIEIETNGRILFENDEYIKIKKSDGTIEKIYKDGRDR